MTGFIHYVWSFGLILGVLVVVHEFGHFIIARWSGVKVLRFSVGFGRVLWSRKFGADRTEFALSAFPLGGYVRMLDEREGEVAASEVHRAFNRQSVWRRAAIVVAGPGANLLLAVLLNWVVFVHGIDEIRPLLGVPVVSSAAEKAGISAGDRVVKIAGDEIDTWQEMRWRLIKLAVDHDVVQLDLLTANRQVVQRNLDLRIVRTQGWQGDAIEKLGLTLYEPYIPAVIDHVDDRSAGQLAGLRAGDRIVRIDGKTVRDSRDVVVAVGKAVHRTLMMDVLRSGNTLAIPVKPAAIVDRGVTKGRIGVAFTAPGARQELMIRMHYGPLVAVGKAVAETWDKSAFSLRMIGRMIVGEVSWHNIGGPVTIASYAGQSARLGLDYYLRFMALVSVSLAVLNLLPVPILDGGHLLYYVLEAIRRRPLSEKVMEIGQQIGLALLLVLMAFAFYNDVNRLISG